MPTQHKYRPQSLALAIALALGCAEFAVAQQVAGEQYLPSSPTPEKLIADLDAFLKAKDTTALTINKATDGTILLLDEHNDLVMISGRGSITGLVDGGDGENVMQLNVAKGGTLGETQRFQRLDVKQGSWTATGSGDFSLGALVRPKATLINEGVIAGGALVQGNLFNKGNIRGDVAVLADGTLNNMANIEGGVEVRENSVFSGKGKVGALDVAGHIVVDRSQGAPTVTGDMSLAKTAVLSYEISPDGPSETIKVGGTASLGDATLKIDWVKGQHLQIGHYTIIEAGKVEGKFDTVINDLAFMDASLDKSDEKSVVLTYARNDVTVEDQATSDNGKALGRSIEKPAVAVNAAIDALLGSNVHTASIAIDQLSGFSTANLAKATLSSDAPISASMLSAMRQLGSISGHTLAGQNNTPRLASGVTDRGRIWVQALGHGGKLDRDFHSALQFSTEGLLLGADWSLDEQWRLGVIGGKSRTRMNGALLDGDLEGWHVGSYALRQSGPSALRLGMAFSGHKGNTQRRIAFNGFSDRPKGRYDATTQQAFAEIGYNLGSNAYSVEPFASLGYQRYQRESYTEKGGDAALQVQGQTRDNFTSTFGLRLAKLSTFDNGMQLTPRFSAGWKHTFGDVYSQTHQKLVTYGSRFTVEGAALDRNSVMPDAGLDLGLSAKHSIGLGFNGEVGDDTRNYGVMGQWQMAF